MLLQNFCIFRPQADLKAHQRPECLLELYYIDYTIWHNAGSITQNTLRFNRLFKNQLETSFVLRVKSVGTMVIFR